MSTPIYSGSGPFERDVFVGREAELYSISSAFQRGARIVNVCGAGGTGKSALARMYSERDSSHPGGVVTVLGRVPEFFDSLYNAVTDLQGPGQQLIIVDGVDEIHDRSSAHRFASVVQILQERERDLDFLITSRSPIPIDPDRQVTITLSGLRSTEATTLLEQLGASLDNASAESLVQMVSGHPLALQMVAALLRNGTLIAPELFALLSDFDRPGLVGLNGEPLRVESKAESRIIVDVSTVNAQLLQILSREPDLIRSIPSRKFEEVVAELLSRHGYEVTLTPASNDGGFDMYAAKKDTLGHFLYLVECKRYTPPNKVGVEIVRSLHGVVNSEKATAGVVVTSSFFTSGAQEFQRRNKHQIQLHDYLAMRSWLNGL